MGAEMTVAPAPASTAARTASLDGNSSATRKTEVPSPALGKGKGYLWLRTASRIGPGVATPKTIAITEAGDRSPMDQVIAIKRNQ